MSIPIFTAQLRKARLATNQANARAAYAEAVANMLDDKNTATGFTYTVSTATCTKTGTASNTNVTIANWGVDDKLGTSTALGDKAADQWIIEFNAATSTSDASIKGIDPVFN